MAQDGPFRTTRSNKIFSPWASDKGCVAVLAAPEHFATAQLIKQAERRARKHAAESERRVAEAEVRAAEAEKSRAEAEARAAEVDEGSAGAEARAAEVDESSLSAEAEGRIAQAVACCIDDDVDTPGQDSQQGVGSLNPPAVGPSQPPDDAAEGGTIPPCAALAKCPGRASSPPLKPAKRARREFSPQAQPAAIYPSAGCEEFPPIDRPARIVPSANSAPLPATDSRNARSTHPSAASPSDLALQSAQPATQHSPLSPASPQVRDDPPHANRKERLKERSKKRSKQHRQERREREAQSAGTSTTRAPKKVALSRLDNAVLIEAPLVLGPQNGRGSTSASGKLTSISPAPSGFVGSRPARSKNDPGMLTKEEAMSLGFRYIEWDGRTPHVILDGQGRVIGVLAGTPRDDKWPDVMEEACAALDEARCALGKEREETKHRRGTFSVIAGGISYGGGQKEPCNRSLSKGEQDVVDALLADSAIQRIAGFGDGAFSLFCPKLHSSYAENMDALRKWKPTLRPNFDNSVFGSVTFNLGPRTQTVGHTDFQNRAAGMCAITALGTFDHTQSGHIILWEMEMIIEFPANSTALIPSALVKHSNTTVQPHERRYSVTQYSAGGLFRWVECGFKTEKAFLASGGSYKQTGAERWRRGVDLFSNWADLCSSAPSSGSEINA